MPIPMGTLVTAGDNIFFGTIAYAEIPAGELTVTVDAACTTPGVIGNSYTAGKLNAIVRPLPFMPTVINITDAEGGADTESDNAFAERIYLAPSGYSVAGPDAAYIFWVKSYSALIQDVKVPSPSPGVVDVRVLLTNGEIPDKGFLDGLLSYLRNSNVIPLTDNVVANPPDIIPYDLDVTYFISTANQNNAITIQNAVNLAFQSYIRWQRSSIGRDINPDALINLFIQAGAKRAQIRSPVFTVINDTSVANENLVNLIYGGLEDD